MNHVIIVFLALTLTLQFNIYDYSFKGKNWINSCSTGIFQSPIDIPNQGFMLYDNYTRMEIIP